MRGIILAFALAAFGCEGDPAVGQTTESGPGTGGVTSTSGGSSGPACGDLGDAFLDADCRGCAQDSCCQALAECDASEACTKRYGCERACADAACVEACAAAHPNAEPAAALVSCMGACSDVCAAPSTICDSSLSAGRPACDECLGAHCCGEVASCLADAICAGCIESGDAAPCDGDLLYAAALGCFSSQCAAACDG